MSASATITFQPADYSASLWTVFGENAGAQTAKYSAPSGSGVLYRIH
jgi:hypothetical protein